MRSISFLLVSALCLQATSFEVASIKPSRPGSEGSDIDVDNALLRMRNVTVKRCIMRAYSIPESEIMNGPKWISENRYDIDAKADHPVASDEIATMLQSLLTERFDFSFHHDSRVLSGYALVQTSGGIKAEVAPPDTVSETSKSRNHLRAKGCSMQRFAMRLSAILNIPVVDATGLQGKYDFDLRWSPDDMQASTFSNPSQALQESSKDASLFTAVREQLGLKLESRKVNADVLIIDRIQPPTAN
ncbi:MAG: TIGR03435 family protein [Acidobacteriaceae bacterium]|nr:TIGR03435 family protein [Acidobacteriaceae bacterium]